MNVTERLRARIQARGTVPVLSAALPSLPHFNPPPPGADEHVSWLSERLERRALFGKEREDPAQYAEVLRVCRLPRVVSMTQEELEAFSAKNVLSSARAEGWDLWPIQAEAVLTYQTYGGLFAPIGVGWGKTLIGLMVAEYAFRNGHKKSMLLVPASVYPQLVRTNIPWARSKVPITVPFHPLGGKTMAERRMITRSGRAGCYLMPYSCLSTKDTRTAPDPRTGRVQEGLIEAINPSLVIGDEIHYLANRGAARTSRLVNWMEESQPQLVCMSGTITNKSVLDYHHLIKRALGKNSPLPLSRHLAAEWGQVLDADSYFSESQTGAIRPLVDWARNNYPRHDYSFDRSGFRRAYKHRLISAPGVVATGDLEIQTSLTLATRPVQKPEQYAGWEELQRLTDDVVERFVTPNGDEIQHRIHSHKWLKELTAGFYNELTWPKPAEVMESAGVELAEAEDMLERALQHHEAKQEYSKLLRKWLGSHKIPGLDTPMAVGSEISHNGPKTVGSELSFAWHRERDTRFDGMPKRKKREVRVCGFKIEAALQWCKSLPKGEGALVWYQHQEVGRWFSERAAEEGLDFLHCPAGDASNKALDLDENPHNATKILVCSIQAHQEGKNLQPMGHTYFLEWNQTARIAEQVLGRNHRKGQMRDELTPVLCLTTDFDQLSFAASLNNALYIHQSVGNRQKLIYCGYDPIPQVFSPELLRERGFQLKKLTLEQQRQLKEQFGDFKEVA